MLAAFLVLPGWSWILCLLASQAVLPLSPGPQSAGATPTPAGTVQQVWALSFGELRRAPLLPLMPLGDLVLVADEHGGLSALHSATGELRWFVHGLMVAWIAYFVYQFGDFQEQISINRDEVDILKREINVMKLSEVGHPSSRLSAGSPQIN